MDVSLPNRDGSNAGHDRDSGTDFGEDATLVNSLPRVVFRGPAAHGYGALGHRQAVRCYLPRSVLYGVHCRSDPGASVVSSGAQTRAGLSESDALYTASFPVVADCARIAHRLTLA